MESMGCTSNQLLQPLIVIMLAAMTPNMVFLLKYFIIFFFL